MDNDIQKGNQSQSEHKAKAKDAKQNFKKTHLFPGWWWAVEEVVWIGWYRFEVLRDDAHEFILSIDYFD